MSDLLKPITVEGRRAEFIFDPESFVLKLRAAMEDEMRKFGAKTPTCIRCGEKPFIMPRNLTFYSNSEGWSLKITKGEHDSQHADLLRFNLTGWRELTGGEHEALCPECLEFVKTVGKAGGA